MSQLLEDVNVAALPHHLLWLKPDKMHPVLGCYRNSCFLPKGITTRAGKINLSTAKILSINHSYTLFTVTLL